MSKRGASTSRTVAFFVCVALSLAPSFARADELRLCVPSSMLSSSMPTETKLLLTRQLDDELMRARNLRHGGIATAVVGAVFTLMGVPVLLHAALCDNCDSRGDVTGAGIALTASGTTLSF